MSEPDVANVYTAIAIIHLENGVITTDYYKISSDDKHDKQRWRVSLGWRSETLSRHFGAPLRNKTYGCGRARDNGMVGTDAPLRLIVDHCLSVTARNCLI